MSIPRSTKRTLVQLAVIGTALILAGCASAKQYRPNLKLQIKLEKTTYLPREPIVFTLELESFDPDARIPEIDWEEDVFVTVTGYRGKQKRIREKWLWVGGSVCSGQLPDTKLFDPNTKPEDLVAKTKPFPSRSKITSHPINLLDLSDDDEVEHFMQKGWHTFRCDRLELTIRLTLRYSLDISRLGEDDDSDTAEYSAGKTIKIIQPTGADWDALRLLDLCLTPPDSLSRADKMLLRGHGIPIPYTDIPKSDFLLIIRNAFPDSIYAAEAGYHYGRLLDAYEKGQEAKKAYQWVIDNYPKSWWAHRARQDLKELKEEAKKQK